MKDEKKTKAQLIAELQNLRKECEATRRLSSGEKARLDVFYSIVQNATDAIIIANDKGIIVYCNSKAEEMFGYEAGEMLGKCSSDLIPQDRRPAEEEAIRRNRLNVAGGFIGSLKEGSILRKNGGSCMVEASYYGLHFDGEYFLTGIFHDISLRKNFERAMEEAKDFSDNIIESSLDSIVIVDTHGYIIRTNSSFLQLMGAADPHQVIGKQIAALSPDHEGVYELTTGERLFIGQDFLQTAKLDMLNLLQKNKIPQVQSYLMRVDNRVVPVEESINFLYDKNGGRIGAVGVIRDMTERRKAERELSESRDFLARLFQTSLEGIIVSNERGTITMVNDRAAEMLAYAKSDLIGKHFGNLSLTMLHEKGVAHTIIESFLRQKTLWGVERTWMKGDGSLIDVEMNISTITNPAGNMIGAMASFRDISRRKQAETALRLSEERYRRIFENSFIALLEIDISPVISAIDTLKAKGMRDINSYLQEHPEFLQKLRDMFVFIGINDAYLKLYGARNLEELIRSRDVCLRGESITAAREAIIAFAEGKSYFQSEAIHYTIQGIQKNILMQAIFLTKQRDSNRLLLNAVDITPIKQAEQRLLDYQQQLRSLTNELSAKEEQERRNLGMYLHDRIGQSLSALKMQLEMMASELAGGTGREKLGQSIKLLEKTIHDTRVLSYELSPVILHELGLEVALGWLTEQIQKQHNLTGSFTGDNKAKQLDDDVKIILYRAVSELLLNVVKHGWAQHVAVSIKRRNGQVNITVEDDGVGFDPAQLEGIAAAERGFGLFSIRERLRYLGGNVLIKSAPYKGTRITLSAPLKDSSRS